MASLAGDARGFYHDLEGSRSCFSGEAMGGAALVADIVIAAPRQSGPGRYYRNFLSGARIVGQRCAGLRHRSRVADLPKLRRFVH